MSYRDRLREMEQSFAPWTPDQVQSLNEYQDSGCFHPYTCWCGENLVAMLDGWSCDCGRTQAWAWEWSADWSWKALFDALPWNKPGFPARLEG